MEKNPKVFISYSYDTVDHANKVLELSNKLRSDGIDSIIDQYIQCPPEGWPRWMEKQIRDADFVLMICTKAYYQRIVGEEQPGSGLGVRWEGNLIYQHIYNAGTLNNKFIPVLFSYSNYEDIPTPVQNATHYDVDITEKYHELYWRLRGVQKIEKPPLGQLHPLKPKEKQTDVSLFLTGFINLDLWNAAKWKGTGFVHDKQMIEPPWLVICFINIEPAIKIFEGWHKRLGCIDESNEMRISIVEGDVEGEEPGYTVHIGSNIVNIIKRADNNGINIPRDYFIIISRIHRMNPPPGSRNLELFKKHYQRLGSYYLMPGILKNNEVIPLDNLRILKRNIEFRNVDDIKSKNDPDAVILKKFSDSLPGQDADAQAS